MSRSVVILTVSLASFAAAVGAQGRPEVQTQAKRPDFSGNWTLDQAKSGPLVNPFLTRPGGGGTFSLKVDATSLTRTTIAADGKPQSIVYKLNGRQTPFPPDYGSNMTYNAKWQGNTIVIETTTIAKNGNKGTYTSTYSIEGQWLVIANSNKTYYKKATQKN